MSDTTTNRMLRMGDTEAGDDPRHDKLLLLLHGKKGRKAVEMANAPRIDDGYFGQGSLSWKIYNNIIVSGMGAVAGLLISCLEPHGAYGVGHHTVYYSDTIGRVRRSLEFFAGAVFGDSAMATKVGRDLFRKHSHVTGEVPYSGETLRANHVETMKFTYVVGWPHLWRAYKAFGDPNAPEEEERQFYAEQNRVCELMGMLPRTPEGVEEYVREAEESIYAVTQPAQELRDFLFHPPLAPIWPLGLLNLPIRLFMWAGVPLLTPRVREILDLDKMKIRPMIGTFVIKQAAKLIKVPFIDRAIVSYCGFETWGYYYNAVRRSPGTGAVPFTHDPGLALQRGKRGTLPPSEAQAPTEAARKPSTAAKRAEARA